MKKQLLGGTLFALSCFPVYSQAIVTELLINLMPEDVNIAVDLATQVQVGASDLGAPVFVSQITTDTTLSADQTYFLQEEVFVTNGATLTIEAGTVIYAAAFEFDPDLTSDNVVGSLIVTRGADIVVQGTEELPVVMTTVDSLEALRNTDVDNDGVVASAPTQNTTGRWGGLTILGNAFVANFTDSDTDSSSGNEINLFEGSIEGFGGLGFEDLDSDGFSDLLEFGSSANSDSDVLALNNAESSGSIQFLSIRHGGFMLSDGNEINGLTMAGVGSGTVIDHVEVVANEDDAFEWFGGTVNSSHLVAAFSNDDSFDIDLGHSGTHQFWFAIYDGDGGDHGGEWDGTNVNDGDSSPADGLGNSNPLIANVTFLDTGNSDTTEAIRFDDFFSGILLDSAIDNFGVDETYDNESDGIGLGLTVINNVFAGNNNVAPSFNAGNDYDTELNLVSVSALPNGLLDPRPTADSLLLTSASDFSQNPLLDDVSYRGAFGPDELFISGWTFLQEAGFLPDLAPAAEEVEIIDCGVVGSNFNIRFLSTNDASYRIMFSTDLTDGFVNVVSGQTGIQGTGGEISSTFLMPNAAPRLFFRVEEE